MGNVFFNATTSDDGKDDDVSVDTIANSPEHAPGDENNVLDEMQESGDGEGDDATSLHTSDVERELCGEGNDASCSTLEVDDPQKKPPAIETQHSFMFESTNGNMDAEAQLLEDDQAKVDSVEL